MTINNLTRNIRRKQFILFILIVGFLLIFKEVIKTNNNDIVYKVKSDLYHFFINTIFKRTSNIFFKRFKANIIYNS